MLDKLKIVKDAGLKSIEICKTAGVKLGFGTDLLGNSFEHQSREFEIRRQAQPIRDVIRSATKLNAEILQQEGELGVIKEGAIADLLLIEKNPFESPDVLQGQGAHIPLIMKGGKIYKNNLI